MALMESSSSISYPSKSVFGNTLQIGSLHSCSTRAGKADILRVEYSEFRVWRVSAQCGWTHMRGDEMATFALVDGAWGGGWAWKQVATLLREAGHEVYAPTLTGLGERVSGAVQMSPLVAAGALRPPAAPLTEIGPPLFRLKGGAKIK